MLRIEHGGGTRCGSTRGQDVIDQDHPCSRWWSTPRSPSNPVAEILHSAPGVQADGIPGAPRREQTGGDPGRVAAPDQFGRGRSGHHGHRVTAADPGCRRSGRRRHQPYRQQHHGDPDQPGQPNAECEAQPGRQIAATMLLTGQDRGPNRAAVTGQPVGRGQREPTGRVRRRQQRPARPDRQQAGASLTPRFAGAAAGTGSGQRQIGEGSPHACQSGSNPRLRRPPGAECGWITACGQLLARPLTKRGIRRFRSDTAATFRSPAALPD